MNKKTIWIILLCFLVLIAIPLTLYFYSKTQKVSIINNSKYFQVSYKATPYFTSRLNEWNVFGKYRIKMSDYSSFFTVKSIQIVLTDIKQARLQTYAGNNRNNLLASFGARVTGDHILIINAYINPAVAKNPESNNIVLSNLLYTGIISVLYDVTHNEEKETKDKHIQDEVYKINSLTMDNPFTLESKKSN